MSSQPDPYLLGLLQLRVAPGLWQLDEIPLDATATAEAMSWHVIELAVGPTTDKSMLLSDLGQAGSFPGYYGANWDAAADCLNDVDRLGPGPLLMILRGAGEWAAAQPVDAKIFAEIVAETSQTWASHGRQFFALWQGSDATNQVPSLNRL